eukprot:gene8703-10223_t
MRRASTVLLLLLLGTLMQQYILEVEAMTYSRDVTIRDKYYLIDTFGFESSGFVRLSIKQGGDNYDDSDSNNPDGEVDKTTGDPLIEPILEDHRAGEGPLLRGPLATVIPNKPYFDYLTLWICEDRDYQTLIGSPTSNTIETKLCANPQEGACPVRNVSVGTGNFAYAYSVVESNYTMMNPGSHLSRGFLPLPRVYLYITIAMTVLFAANTVHLSRNRGSLNELHYVIEFVLALKTILVFLTFMYWKSAEDSGKFSMVLRYMMNLFFSLEETAFFGGLLLLSKGWRITRTYLPMAEIRTIIVILVLLISVLLFFSFYNDHLFGQIPMVMVFSVKATSTFLRELLSLRELRMDHLFKHWSFLAKSLVPQWRLKLDLHIVSGLQRHLDI